MKILLVNLDDKNSDELGRILSGWGMIVTRAASAQQAVELVKKQLFKFVLIELSLQDSCWFDAIPKLKLFNPGIRILVMTGNSTPELEKKARECGIVFYAGKPVPLDQLKLIISQLSE